MVIGASELPVLDDSMATSDGFDCLGGFRLVAFLGATADAAISLVVGVVTVEVAGTGFLGGRPRFFTGAAKFASGMDGSGSATSAAAAERLARLLAGIIEG